MPTKKAGGQGGNSGAGEDGAEPGVDSAGKVAAAVIAPTTSGQGALPPAPARSPKVKKTAELKSIQARDNVVSASARQTSVASAAAGNTGSSRQRPCEAIIHRIQYGSGPARPPAGVPLRLVACANVYIAVAH